MIFKSEMYPEMLETTYNGLVYGFDNSTFDTLPEFKVLIINNYDLKAIE